MSRRQILVLGLVALCSVIAGTLHYAGASDIAAFAVAGLALAGLAWIVAFATEAPG